MFQGFVLVMWLLCGVSAYAESTDEAIANAFLSIEAENVWDTVLHLSAYPNRSAREVHGVNAAQWIKNKVDNMALFYGRLDTESVLIPTGFGMLQPSVVTVIGKDLQAPALVLGAHLDTLGQRMPGADDDASGSAVILEVARVLLARKAPLNRPVYVIWYAAEERGLLGSKAVASALKAKGQAIHSVIQFDMTGYQSTFGDKTIWLFRDYTSPELTDFLAGLIQTYLKVPVGYSTCGYGCSDHASWYALGIPTAFPCESSYSAHNPNIHTSNDTINWLSLTHMTDFTRLGLAYVLSLAGTAF